MNRKVLISKFQKALKPMSIQYNTTYMYMLVYDSAELSTIICSTKTDSMFHDTNVVVI